MALRASMNMSSRTLCSCFGVHRSSFQNQFSGHLRYSKDDPAFITTLATDLTQLKGKKFLQQGDVDMILKRLLVLNFTKPIVIPLANGAYCNGCKHCYG